MLFTVRSATKGPTSAPALPPAAMTPNKRFVCPRSKISSRKLQKTEIKNRLTTLMKT